MRKRYLIFLVALVLGGLILLFVRSKFSNVEQLTNGPVYKLTIGNPNIWTQTAASRPVNFPIVIGGSEFKNTTDKPIVIKQISVTNVPKGIKIVSIGLNLGPPNIGGLDYSSRTLKGYHLMHKFPYTIKPEPTSHVYQPYVAFKAISKGTYAIQGFLITYQWGTRTYQDYIPNQAGIFAGVNASRITPPPPTWPLHH